MMVIPCSDNTFRDQPLILKFKSAHIEYRDQLFKINNIRSVSEINEFKPRLKSPQNRFQLSAGLNLEKWNTIYSGTNHI